MRTLTAAQWGSIAIVSQFPASLKFGDPLAGDFYTTGLVMSVPAGAKGGKLTFISASMSCGSVSTTGFTNFFHFARLIVVRGTVQDVTPYVLGKIIVSNGDGSVPASAGASLPLQPIYEAILPMSYNQTAVINDIGISCVIPFGEHGPSCGPGETLSVILVPLMPQSTDASGAPAGGYVYLALNAFGGDNVGSGLGDHSTARSLPREALR